jgi:hypothetical protein
MRTNENQRATPKHSVTARHGLLVCFCASAAVIALGGPGLRAAGPSDAGVRPGSAKPGPAVEVIAATDLLAMPPGVLRSAKARLQNRIGNLQPGAEVTVLDATETFYKISVECQDGKVRVQAWIERSATRPAAAD